MRTRNRNMVLDTMTSDAYTYTVTTRDCSGNITAQGTFSGAPYTVVTAALYERITDSLGRGKMNPVFHRRMRKTLSSKELYGLFPNGGQNTTSGPGPWWVQAVQSIADTNIGWDVSTNLGYPGGFAIDNSQLDEVHLQNELLSRARQLKADVLLNLVEANQIWPSIKSLANSLPNMARGWNQIRRNLSKVSGAYLAYKFGISPIVSDFMSIQRYLPRLQQDVVRHGDQRESRFSAIAELPITFTPAPSGANPLYSSGYVTKSPVVRYVLVVKPKTKYHTAFFKKADFLFNRFATSPASLAWELVPFSFVVDWFVDLRGTLNTLDRLVGSEPYEIVGFTRSFSYATIAQLSYGNLNACNGTKMWESPAVTHECNHYERIPVTPGGFSALWSPRFGKSQAGISAALISQALSKIKA